MSERNETLLWFAAGIGAIALAYFGWRDYRLYKHEPTDQKKTKEETQAAANYVYMHGGYFAGIQPTTFDPDTVANKSIERSTSPYGIFFTG